MYTHATTTCDLYLECIKQDKALIYRYKFWGTGALSNKYSETRER